MEEAYAELDSKNIVENEAKVPEKSDRQKRWKEKMEKEDDKEKMKKDNDREKVEHRGDKEKRRRSSSVESGELDSGSPTTSIKEEPKGPILAVVAVLDVPVEKVEDVTPKQGIVKERSSSPGREVSPMTGIEKDSSTTPPASVVEQDLSVKIELMEEGAF